ncbi:MAG TPA: hypothetical protein DCE23_04470 [Firmicutes bacterium]|nr:hypothetical protein [Bacillota bacterium]
MQYPVNTINIKNPFKKGHYGVDFGWDSSIKGAESNQPIYAVEKGKVISIQKQVTGGNVLIIRHENGYVSEYAHLSKILVKLYDEVERGEHVANMGHSGIVTGPHLHFGLYKGTKLNYKDKNNFVDPLKYLEKEKNQIISSKSKEKEKILEKRKEVFPLGNYKTLSELNIRSGPGTNYSQKKVKDLTKDGKKNATSTNLNSLAVYKKGTVFTALEIIKKDGVWTKTPSGYICIKGKSGKDYCKKI